MKGFKSLIPVIVFSISVILKFIEMRNIYGYIKAINESDLPTLWTIGYKKKNPLWAKYDAPYFHEYKQYTYDNFIKNEGNFFQNKNVYGIFVDELIAYVSYHFILREGFYQ